MSYRLSITCFSCQYTFGITFRDYQWGAVGSTFTCPNCDAECEA